VISEYIPTTLTHSAAVPVQGETAVASQIATVPAIPTWKPVAHPQVPSPYLVRPLEAVLPATQVSHPVANGVEQVKQDLWHFWATPMETTNPAAVPADTLTWTEYAQAKRRAMMMIFCILL